MKNMKNMKHMKHMKSVMFFVVQASSLHTG